MDLEDSPQALSVYLIWMGGLWPRAVTIKSSLMSGCGLSHESAQGGYKGHLSWAYLALRQRRQLPPRIEEAAASSHLKRVPIASLPGHLHA